MSAIFAKARTRDIRHLADVVHGRVCDRDARFRSRPRVRAGGDRHGRVRRHGRMARHPAATQSAATQSAANRRAGSEEMTLKELMYRAPSLRELHEGYALERRVDEAVPITAAHEVTIDASIHVVWSVLSDPARWPGIDSAIRDVEVEGRYNEARSSRGGTGAPDCRQCSRGLTRRRSSVGPATPWVRAQSIGTCCRQDRVARPLFTARNQWLARCSYCSMTATSWTHHWHTGSRR